MPSRRTQSQNEKAHQRCLELMAQARLENKKHLVFQVLFSYYGVGKLTECPQRIKLPPERPESGSPDQERNKATKTLSNIRLKRPFLYGIAAGEPIHCHEVMLGQITTCL